MLNERKQSIKKSHRQESPDPKLIDHAFEKSLTLIGEQHRLDVRLGVLAVLFAIRKGIRGVPAIRQDAMPASNKYFFSDEEIALIWRTYLECKKEASKR